MVALSNKLPMASPYLLALRETLAGGRIKQVGRFECGTLSVDLCVSTDSVWALIRRASQGGIALRAAFIGGEPRCQVRKLAKGKTIRLEIASLLGAHVITFEVGGEALDCLRMTVCFTPIASMLVPFLPRDLYPLGVDDDPLRAVGHVEAGQRGLNAALLYFQIKEPAFGNVLYFQNLTAMNDYYRTTETKPDGAVGGEWPELGYLPPASVSNPLPAGKEVTLSDAILVFRPDVPEDERQSARHFLQLLGTAYRSLDLPATQYRDWIDRAERTLRDLDRAPEATIRHYGHRYAHPYTGAEYPDSMVQMSLVQAIHDWAKWRGEPHPLEAEFKAGLGRFYDPRLRILRRYLPNVGDDKDADAVDSWYLYHPLLNLGRLALGGDSKARALFLKAIDSGITAARHFDYKWPIRYKVDDFSVIEETAGADGRGQTDVGGVYAWVMLQAFELTDDKRFLDEARAAVDAAIGLRFNINYQANLTAWGAAACMRLWRITNRAVYLEQSYVYLASFFHNCEIWESEIGLAIHYPNFMGVTCLQDAPYLAIYECFDSYAAFEHYLDDSGPDLEPAARMLIAEYCKYALDRAWFYYPDSLPPDAIAEEQRDGNGHIDRSLCFPVEDLYPDGQPAGQVGQEIYGAGAALIFATRTFHNVEGAPFRLYCDHFIRAMERTGECSLTIALDGGEHCTAGISLVRLKRRKLPETRLATTAGEALRPYAESADRIDHRVPANGRLVLTWR